MTCEVCGLPLNVGDYPCIATPRPHERYHGTVEGDDIPGGFVQTNFGDHPEVFYSKKAMLKRADQLGLRPMERNAGPHDRHVPRWASVDLEAATALVSRSGVAPDPEIICETAHFEVKAV